MTQIITNLTSYSEHRPEDGVKDNWAAEYAKREVDKHREAEVLDHPDGCVTKNKLSPDVRETIADAKGKSETAKETADNAKVMAQSAKDVADIASKESENAYEKSLDAYEKSQVAENIATGAKNKAESAEQRSVSAEAKADAATVSAGVAIEKADAAMKEAGDALAYGVNILNARINEVEIRADEALTIASHNAENKADKSELPKKVSELENDAEYVTEDGLKNTVISFDGCVEEGYYSDNEVDNIIEEGVYKLCDRFLSTRLSAILVVSYSPAASTLPDGSIVHTSIHQTLIDQNGVSKRDFNIDENKWGSWVHAYEEIKKKVSKEELQEELEWKVDRPDIVQNSASGGGGVYRFEKNYNKEYRWGQRDGISFYFGNDGYEEDYISGLSFDSGATPTMVDYAIPEEPTQISVINWVGTDCAPDSYIKDNGETVPISKFQPSANTHYDIAFYFNGVQFIGLVNGFVPATGNEAV